MKQEKLEEKVAELFHRQDFEIEKQGNKLIAEKDDQELVLKAFSSDKYSEEEVRESAEEDEKVFVDEGLEELEGKLDADVSVIREQEDEAEYNLPSYELIGEIAVINELTVDEEDAVEGILEHHPSVKTILVKQEPLQGEFRVGEYRELYGEETETIHKEHGCRFKVDPTKVYYSERFSTERKRVVDQIEDGEKVLVMFSGVGPFAIMAAKLANPEKVVAVEKNPVAADYLKENIELNDVGDVVEGHEGDVQDIVPDLDEEFDRVIMPLPEKADNYLGSTKSILHRGSTVHLYTFRLGIEESEYAEFETDKIEKCGEKNPKVSRVCLDLVFKP
ncbi:class I SAM-dependent methyltransferase [Candidatus Nanohalobium constans]|uniref:tRNA (Guanine37-N1)-methyltransferase n=1 Tax=Candidatus Nanohalobium constans TaxID=2565781 RepID=A0A5Q0UGU0_9ARCH|nr:methyltransferase [Candidatus Nanohalobium constans]QGA80804.1 tRNA (guanine37-N1)-methyltransferase [Candidatus Nanohalobium constans]